MEMTRDNQAELMDLQAENERLRQQVERLQQTNQDLLVTLETTALHGDIIEQQLEEANRQLQFEIGERQRRQAALQSLLNVISRQKSDLEVILQTTIEHGDAVETELADLNQRLEAEISERVEAEDKLRLILNTISKKKMDLEIILQTLIEHGDAVEAQWYNKAVEANILATIDNLTQIANRRKLDDYLAEEWARLGRDCLPLSFLLCDVDFFKTYNDTFGHQAGDRCLQEVAQAIAVTVKRPADLVARYGGEEFAVILPNTPLAGALQVGERIRQAIENLCIVQTPSCPNPYVTISVGVATAIPGQGMSIASLIAIADQCLYLAKQRGRNRVCNLTAASV